MRPSIISLASLAVPSLADNWIIHSTCVFNQCYSTGDWISGYGTFFFQCNDGCVNQISAVPGLYLFSPLASPCPYMARPAGH